MPSASEAPAWGHSLANAKKLPPTLKTPIIVSATTNIRPSPFGTSPMRQTGRKFAESLFFMGVFYRMGLMGAARA